MAAELEQPMSRSSLTDIMSKDELLYALRQKSRGLSKRYKKSFDPSASEESPGYGKTGEVRPLVDLLGLDDEDVPEVKAEVDRAIKAVGDEDWVKAYDILAIELSDESMAFEREAAFVANQLGESKRQEIVAESVEFSDRYQALGIPYPDVNTMCAGQCEGTGFVPTQRDNEEPWKSLWDEAEAKEHSDDGWHFVVCPDCKGTGKAKIAEGIRSRYQGKVIAELQDDGSYLVVYPPDGEVREYKDKQEAEREIKKWFKHDLTAGKNSGETMGVGEIEWRASRDTDNSRLQQESSGVYIFGGVQMSKPEYDKVKAVVDAGVCPYCGRAGLSQGYGSGQKHIRACGRRLSLLDKEKVLAGLVSEGRVAMGLPGQCAGRKQQNSYMKGYVVGFDGRELSPRLEFESDACWKAKLAGYEKGKKDRENKPEGLRDSAEDETGIAEATRRPMTPAELYAFQSDVEAEEERDRKQRDAEWEERVRSGRQECPHCGAVDVHRFGGKAHTRFTMSHFAGCPKMKPNADPVAGEVHEGVRHLQSALVPISPDVVQANIDAALLELDARGKYGADEASAKLEAGGLRVELPRNYSGETSADGKRSVADDIALAIAGMVNASTGYMQKLDDQLEVNEMTDKESDKEWYEKLCKREDWTKAIYSTVKEMGERFGVEVEELGQANLLASVYVFVGDLVVRLADHPQPEYGGYNSVEGYRYGRADVSIEMGEETEGLESLHQALEQSAEEAGLAEGNESDVAELDVGVDSSVERVRWLLKDWVRAVQNSRNLTVIGGKRLQDAMARAKKLLSDTRGGGGDEGVLEKMVKEIARLVSRGDDWASPPQVSEGIEAKESVMGEGGASAVRTSSLLDAFERHDLEPHYTEDRYGSVFVAIRAGKNSISWNDKQGRALDVRVRSIMPDGKIRLVYVYSVKDALEYMGLGSVTEEAAMSESRETEVRKVTYSDGETEGFTVYKDSGAVATPGKFEGEQLYTPYVYNIIMNGLADEEVLDADDILYSAVLVDEEMAGQFPELDLNNVVVFWESDSGFANTELKTKDEWEKVKAEIESEQEGRAEGGKEREMGERSSTVVRQALDAELDRQNAEWLRRATLKSDKRQKRFFALMKQGMSADEAERVAAREASGTGKSESTLSERTTDQIVKDIEAIPPIRRGETKQELDRRLRRIESLEAELDAAMDREGPETKARVGAIEAELEAELDDEGKSESTLSESYYTSRLEDIRRENPNADIQELGDEVAIVNDEFVLVGGDAPTAYELSGITPEIAIELARLGRSVGDDAQEAYDDFIDEHGIREIVWESVKVKPGFTLSETGERIYVGFVKASSAPGSSSSAEKHYAKITLDKDALPPDVTKYTVVRNVQRAMLWIQDMEDRYADMEDVEDTEVDRDEDVTESTLSETGEADQDYDHKLYDAICAAIQKAGFECKHREFDKYQGVVVTVTGMGVHEKLWTVKRYTQGSREGATPKYKKAYLRDEEGEQYSATKGDYFNQPKGERFQGLTLVLVGQDGAEQEIENPVIDDLPKDGEVETGFKLKKGTESETLLLSPESNTDVELMVSVKDGVADVAEVVEYLEGKEKTESVEEARSVRVGDVASTSAALEKAAAVLRRRGERKEQLAPSEFRDYEDAWFAHRKALGKEKTESVEEAASDKSDFAWRCQECGRKFASEKAAERAAFGDHGCPNCGSSDIDMSLPIKKEPKE